MYPWICACPRVPQTALREPSVTSSSSQERAGTPGHRNWPPPVRRVVGLAGLAQLETAIVQDDREGVATRYAHERGAIVVLKGAKTVIAAPDGRVHTDAHSVVALATGGTGDVLAGLVGSFIAQRLDPFDAAVAAVTVHAHAGLLVQTRRGRAGALASDLLRALPRAQEQLRRALEAG